MYTVEIGGGTVLSNKYLYALLNELNTIQGTHLYKEKYKGKYTIYNLKKGKKAEVDLGYPFISNEPPKLLKWIDA